MRYLKNKDIYTFENKTASQVFSKICGDFSLTHEVTNASSLVLSTKIYDGKTLFEIMESAIDETLARGNQWYMIRDDFGTLKFMSVPLQKN